jgi:hypothetical protein
MQVIVQTNDATRLAITAIALQHFAPKPKPLTPICLDENSP